MPQFVRGKVASAFILILSVYLFANCTPKQIASDITSQIMRSGAPAFEMESDVDIAETSGLTMIKMMEAFQHDNPNNKNYLILLSRSYANYGFGFLEWNMLKYKSVDEGKRALNESRAKQFYAKGKAYGLQLLTRNSAFEGTLKKDMDSFKKALKGMGRGSLEPLFWTALNWGSYINLNKDSPLAIAEFPRAEAMMQRVYEIDENFYYGGPLLFFGVSFGSRPTMFGGNPQKSKEFFEKALAAYKRKFLMTQVLYAQTYCVQNQDKAMFETLLNEVLSTDAAVLPEARLANEIAKQKAAWLLSHENQYF
ncbi:TRAP transporter TatT component family protein [bacterium]|nr:TRAP transporter TatT component family protein [bacterium]